MVQSDSLNAADWLIYIAGSAKLQGELLAVFIEKETGLPCRIEKTRNMFPARLVPKRRSIIFSDCCNRPAKEIIAGMRECSYRSRSDVFIILFNLDNSLKIEDELLELGLWGIFYEEDPLENMPLGVEAICKGEIWLSRQVMSSCLINMQRHNISQQSDEKNMLTVREREVLVLLREGSGNHDIAATMNISIHTVRSHLYHIFKKIGVSSRYQASIWANRHL